MQVKTVPFPPGKLQDAYDAGAARLKPRDVQAIDADGFPAELDGEPVMHRRRRPPSEKWVTKTGTVVYLRLTSGGAVRRESDFTSERREAMHQSGSVRYGVCPLRDQHSMRWVSPAMRKESPCKPASYGEAKACPHIEQIILERATAHAKAEERRRLANEVLTSAQRAEKQHGELVQGLGALVKGMQHRTTEK